MFIKRKKFNNHTKRELKKHFAGKFISNPQYLYPHCPVTIFYKGTENWWDHGSICKKSDGTKAVNCYDDEYCEFRDVEVYLDTRYVYKNFNKLC